METMKAYVISLTCAAVICSILLPLIKAEGMGKLLRLLCGVFLTLTVISPIRSVELPDILGTLSQAADSGADAAALGDAYAKEGTAAIIKSQTEAYILDKAKELGATIHAEVSLKSLEEPIPLSANIQGSVTPYQRQRLSQYLETSLGITKENQQWHG